MNELIEFWNTASATEILTTIVGYSACITLTFGYLPQTIQTIKTKSTDDIAFGTFLLMGVGSALFALQGFLLGNIPLLITNLLTTVMSTIISFIKIRNDFFKKK